MTTYMITPSNAVFKTDHPEWYTDCRSLSNKEGKVARKEYARAELLSIIKPGQTIYCTLRSKSNSGMSRNISLHIINAENKLRCIDTLASDVTDTRLSKNGGLIMSGCGMDMGFALVYNLGEALWPNGTEEPHSSRNCCADSSGGYALKSSWV